MQSDTSRNVWPSTRKIARLTSPSHFVIILADNSVKQFHIIIEHWSIRQTANLSKICFPKLYLMLLKCLGNRFITPDSIHSLFKIQCHAKTILLKTGFRAKYVRRWKIVKLTSASSLFSHNSNTFIKLHKSKAKSVTLHSPHRLQSNLIFKTLRWCEYARLNCQTSKNRMIYLEYN